MKTDKDITGDDDKSEEEFARARKTAVNILSYSDNSEHRLREKLAFKGFSHEAADHAVEYVIQKGWLDERKQAEAAVRYLAEVKLYGKRRILLELKKRGIKRDVIIQCDIDRFDYAENCRKLWEKRGNEDDVQTAAYLIRAGYSMDDINKVRKSVFGTD